MHDLAFADSTRPTRVVCLRLPLLPYSLGHELLLWQQRNPLLLLSRDDFNALPTQEQIQSLIRAVLTCYRDWNGNHKPERWLGLWGWLIRNTDWPVAIAEFRNYLESGRALLPTLSASNPRDAEAFEIANGEDAAVKGRALGAPFLSQLLLFTVNSLRTPIPAAYDLPFAVVGNLYFTQLESEGRLNIENQKESEIRQEMEAHRKAVEQEELEAKSNG